METMVKSARANLVQGLCDTMEEKKIYLREVRISAQVGTKPEWAPHKIAPSYSQAYDVVNKVDYDAKKV